MNTPAKIICAVGAVIALSVFGFAVNWQYHSWMHDKFHAPIETIEGDDESLSQEWFDLVETLKSITPNDI